MAQILFFLLSIVCVGSILGMILSKNAAYSALYVVLVFTCTAGLFALLDAPFIAVIQLIIYAGAIMVLFIFVIMMIDVRKPVPREKRRNILFFSGGIAVVLLIELIVSVKMVLAPLNSSGNEPLGSPTELGRLLFTKYLYPFEITSVLIIAALVGSIVLVKKKDNS